MHRRIIALCLWSLSLAALSAAVPATAAPERAAGGAAVALAAEPSVETPTQVAQSAPARRAAPVSERRIFTAAGSVLTLADGVVVQARFAQIAVPAPGFVYER